MIVIIKGSWPGFKGLRVPSWLTGVFVRNKGIHHTGIILPCSLLSASELGFLSKHMSHSLNFLKGLYRGLYRGLP